MMCMFVVWINWSFLIDNFIGLIVNWSCGLCKIFGILFMYFNFEFIKIDVVYLCIKVIDSGIFGIFDNWCFYCDNFVDVVCK